MGLEYLESWKRSLPIYVKKEIFSVEGDRFVLEEKGSGSSYKFNVICQLDSTLIKLCPSKMKENTKYLKRQPNDCDYILIDLELQIIFYIELKNDSKSSKPDEIKSQLESGKYWLQHLCFLIGFEIDFSEFEIFKVCCKQKGKIEIDGRGNRPSQSDKGYYIKSGKIIDLRCFYRMCK